VAATLEKAITYVFAGKLIRHAEVRGSIPLCSPNNSHLSNKSHFQLSKDWFSEVANMWLEKSVCDDKKS
jgi:hypothetical protein